MQATFEDLKKYMLSPSLLLKQEAGEILYLYMLASQRAVGAVLVREENKTQHSVYYLGRALKDVEMRYTPLEKMVLALVTTVRRLVPYFRAHPIHVLIDQPLASVLRSPTSSGRMVKWAMELTQYGLEYKPRLAIKAHAFADFIVKCTTTSGWAVPEGPVEGDGWWEMHMDGAASSRHCGGGVVLTSPDGFKTYCSLTYKFP